LHVAFPADARITPLIMYQLCVKYNYFMCCNSLHVSAQVYYHTQQTFEYSGVLNCTLSFLRTSGNSNVLL